MAYDRTQSHTVVFIASDAVLSAWLDRASATEEVVGVSDATKTDLLDVIARQKPQTVVLDEDFAGTDRGAVLIGRLRTTPEFEKIDIRVLWSERVAQMGEQGATPPLTAVATSIRPLYPEVQRAARRHACGAPATIEGYRVELVDLSVLGAQVLAPVHLRPEQRVQMVLADEVRAEARVVWARLEPTPVPICRAGLEFLAVDVAALEKLMPPP
jgi:hypothetical protein